MKPHPDWIVPDWPAPDNVKALITTRAGGTSADAFASMNLGLRSGDQPRAVLANRDRLRVALPQEPRWLRQVHGSHVVNADGLGQEPEADASVARLPNTVCAVLIADCIPVLLTDRSGSVVAVAHAGWRGLAAGVLQNTVARMAVDPGTLLAYLGPGIGPRAFEVGADVRNAFIARDSGAAAAFEPHAPGKWLADLFSLARRQLASIGIARIDGGEACTYSNPERFFSYRRDRTTGRMAALIWRTGESGVTRDR